VKVPVAPPDSMSLLERVMKQGPERLVEIIGQAGGPAPQGKYRHWDTLRHIEPPPRLDTEEWWFAIKLARKQVYVQLPLIAKDGAAFKYALVDPAQRMLHFIDKNASGAIQVEEVVADPSSRDTYLVKSLIEEAITSSQLEGASTTRAVAKEMLQRGRQPRDRSERMIHNNYQAMQFVRSIKGETLTPAMVFELHRILTDQALDDPSAAGRFRRDEEGIVVSDGVGTLLHRPPPASSLPDRMKALCTFANEKDDDSKRHFIHPVLRSILLHFALGYDHPFVDGNGRTARALFYWSMAAQGFWLTEFISISRILKKAPAKYGESFLYVETDENDTTYFILNQLRVVERAIRALHEYLADKTKEIKATAEILKRSPLVHAYFNYRQLALLNHALKHPLFVYTFDSHQRAHAVSYQTARTDLLSLEGHKLLERVSRGRRFVFVAPADLKQRLDSWKGRR